MTVVYPKYTVAYEKMMLCFINILSHCKIIFYAVLDRILLCCLICVDTPTTHPYTQTGLIHKQTDEPIRAPNPFISSLCGKAAEVARQVLSLAA